MDRPADRRVIRSQSNHREGVFRLYEVEMWRAAPQEHDSRILGAFPSAHPHQELANSPPSQHQCPAGISELNLDNVVCHQRLGVLLRRYERTAALTGDARMCVM